ncbi:MAG: type II toxin-antitoxin system Phd/YefM family antitoxin [Chloroflexi bacterium]|nr:type II toxin-antitoxin system Phd/YefM family antitoxin [Chloroflexota bacterium]
MLTILQNPFIGVHELRRDLSHILEAIRTDGQDVVVTQTGKPVAVLMDVERYLEIMEALKDLADPLFTQELMQADQDVSRGLATPAAEVYKEVGLL